MRNKFILTLICLVVLASLVVIGCAEKTTPAPPETKPLPPPTTPEIKPTPEVKPIVLKFAAWAPKTGFAIYRNYDFFPFSCRACDV